MGAAGEGHASRNRPHPPRRATIRRERLLATLAGRFERRLTVIQAGAGFGKTTLLGQAVDENDLDPRGVDIWVDLTASDAPTHEVPAMIAGALGDGQRPDTATIADVVDLVWQRAPDQVVLLVDNLHRVPETEAASQMWAELVEQLPGNGHLVLSSRTDPPFPYARLLATGEAALIDEAELAFDADDLNRFAGLRQVGTSELGTTGWPALLELRATIGTQGERRYIAEEILDGLGTERLSAIQQVSLIGWLDDRIVSEATEFTGTAAELVRGMPLTSRGEDGRIVLHELWQEWLPAMPPAAMRGANRRLARVMHDRGELSAAFRLYVDAGDLVAAQEILREISQDYGLHHPLAVRREIITAMPVELAASPGARLVEADIELVTHPQSSTVLLEQARAAARSVGDAELEAHAVLRLSEMLYQSYNGNDLAEMVDELTRLEPGDPGPVGAVRGLVQIWHALTTNQLELAASIARSPVANAYEPTAAHARYYAGLVAAHTGHALEGLSRLALTLPQLSGLHAARAGGLESMLHFYSGQMDAEKRAIVGRLIERIEASGHANLYVEGSATVALYHFAAGDVARGKDLLDRARKRASELSGSSWGAIVLQLATAALAVIEGDEQRAASLIDRAMPAAGPFDGLNRHIFNNVYALTYILSERSRPAFDADVVGPDLELARDVARAVVQLRESGDTAPAARLPWADIERIKPWAYEPHLAELAVAALVEGNGDAEVAIKSLQYDPHGALELVVERYAGRTHKMALDLLGRTPRRPTRHVRIEVLGPLRVRVGDAVTPASRLRSRVVELLQLLVAQRTVTRSAVLETLWPDLDEARARNNMRVTLNHLMKLLEPDRDQSPPWHVRSEGDVLSLVPSDFLQIDVDDFVSAFVDARNHDRSGVPSRALELYLRCCEIYSGDFLADRANLDVGYDDRTRLRLDFVAAATRGAQLLTAAGRAFEAIELAQRAVAAEPLAESGHSSLLMALRELGRGHDFAEACERCQTAFAEADLVPSDELDRLLALA